MTSGKLFVEMPQAPRKVPGDIEQQDAVLIGHLAVEVVERHVRKTKDPGRFRGLDGGHAGKRVEDATLAEELAGAQQCQFRFAGCSAAFDDSDPAGMDEKHPASGFALANDEGAGNERRLLRFAGKKFESGRIEAAENGDSKQERVHE